jgi:hypothetical protein
MYHSTILVRPNCFFFKVVLVEHDQRFPIKQMVNILLIIMGTFYYLSNIMNLSGLLLLALCICECVFVRIVTVSIVYLSGVLLFAL